MNRVEKLILEEAKNIMPILKDKAEKMQSRCRHVHFPFKVGGVIDTLVYDVELKEFTEIRYKVAKGKRISMLDGYPEVLADDYKIKSIDLKGKA